MFVINDAWRKQTRLDILAFLFFQAIYFGDIRFSLPECRIVGAPGSFVATPFKAGKSKCLFRGGDVLFNRVFLQMFFGLFTQ
ncbi:hypothetical protein FHU10_3810 [Serratia fonticola]|uniref:Uncharacterized protein n=1 Tax=Serratia fonticola TaxID=47917 RepID=A0A542BRS5_SERFO|nr:hypothetical protein FHU09_3897 [Serratia fonticola]TQI96695.1 hypothetical protein FHU11_2149 [Serratia fonticola]TVZ71192.1 hypothetical protein FHU10_3810 [Serratia fonticola]